MYNNNYDDEDDGLKATTTKQQPNALEILYIYAQDRI